MNKEKYIDDYITEGDYAGALRYLANEQYKAMNIGGTRKMLLERVADKLERDKDTIDYFSNVCIALTEEKNKLLEASEEYISLLESELEEVVSIASIHEKGKAIREKLKNAKNFCVGVIKAND